MDKERGSNGHNQLKNLELSLHGENNEVSIGQLARTVPGLTPDVPDGKGGLKTQSNYFAFQTPNPNAEVDGKDIRTKKEVLEGVAQAIASLPKGLIDDVRHNKKHAWIAFGLGVLTITVIGATIESKRGFRDLKSFIDQDHNSTEKKEKLD